jgi:hypothetical protein
MASTIIIPIRVRFNATLSIHIVVVHGPGHGHGCVPGQVRVDAGVRRGPPPACQCAGPGRLERRLAA